MTPEQKLQIEAVIKFIKSKQLTLSLDEANAIINALSTTLQPNEPETREKKVKK